MKTSIFNLALALFPILLYSQIYVDVNSSANGPGISWDNAFTDFSDAIAQADAHDTIWLAGGTYSVPKNMASFVISKPINIYGGFNGDENSIADRDFASTSILSGDRDSNDADSDSSKEDNSLHVLNVNVSDGSFYMNGVTVSGGSAKKEGELGDSLASGGGILISGSALFENCRILNNSAKYGGGVYVWNTGKLAEFVNCDFENNLGTRFGGGLYADDPNNKLSVDNCRFTKNKSESGGGVITGSEGSVATVTNSSFVNNESIRGGGLQVDLGGNLHVDNCQFDSNVARVGAGLRVQGGSVAVVNGSSFTDNSTVFIADDSRPEGGAIHVVTGSKASIDNCDFKSNHSEGAAGAISIQSKSDLSIQNSTMAQNMGTEGAGAILVQDESTLQSSDIKYNINESGDNGLGGAIVGDDNSFIGSKNDLFEQNSSSDGGAIYVEGNTTLNVDGSQFLSNSAFYSGAISVAGEGTELLVKNGEFKDNEAVIGGAIYLYFAGLSSMIQTTFEGNTSEGGGAIIYESSEVGTLVESVFTNNRARSEDSAPGGAIYTVDNDLEISDCRFLKNSSTADGGAISSNSNGKITITNAEFRENKAIWGAAIEAESVELVLNESLIIDNEASDFGGGMCIWEGATLSSDGTVFHANKANFGGAISFDGSLDAAKSNKITKARFYGNIASDGAGAINNYNATLSVENSVFNMNSAVNGGSALQASDVGDQMNKVLFLNNTFINSGEVQGGLITAGSEEADRVQIIEFQNNIFTQSSGVFEIINGQGMSISLGGNVASSDQSEILNHATDQNLTDPLFVNIADGDYRLQDSSSAVNAGVSPAPLFDHLNNSRLDLPDAGAFENQNVIEGIDVVVEGRLYVNPLAIGNVDGTTWRDAFTTLYDGLRFADEGDEIWMANGIYVVPENMESWIIDKGLSIYGGFRGAEVELSSRMDYLFPTILTGDKLLDDVSGDLMTNKSDNAQTTLLISNVEQEVYLNQLSITGGSSLISQGGGIVINGNLTMDDCKVYENVALIGGGLSFENENGKAKFKNSRVTNNLALFAGGVAADGENYCLTIEESSIEGNVALSGGGMWASGLDATVDIINSKIKDNDVQNLGGGIFVENLGLLQIKGGSIESNTAEAGGGIYSDHSNIKAFGTLVQSNFVREENEDIRSSGGGVMAVENSTVNLDSVDFHANSSLFDGAAMSISNAEAKVSNSIFRSNISKVLGGALYIGKTSSLISQNDVYTENATFNTENNFGGAAFVNNSKASFVNANFNLNRSDFGGAIYAFENSEVSVDSSMLMENIADFGAALYVFNTSSFEISKSKFIRNLSFESGGAVYSNEGITTVSNSEFENNSTGDEGAGGAIYSFGGILNIDKSMFLNNKAEFGGAVEVLSHNLSQINESIFNHNEARFGGAICVFDSSDLNVVSSKFFNNIALENGGAIRGLQNAVVSIADSEMRKNKAIYGGAMEMSVASEINLENSLIIDNHAEEWGGGACLFEGATIHMEESEFNTNTAIVGGGLSICASSNEGLQNEILRSKFVNNKTSVGAGGINHFDADLLIQNSLFDRNFSDGIGAAIWTEDAGEEENIVRLVNNTFYQNLSTGGAAISLGGEDGNVRSTVFFQNNILANEKDIETLDEDALPISSGGNLSKIDNSEIINLASDIHETDPLFENPDNFNFRLQEGSPAIGAGVSPGPYLDLDGNARLGTPDIGAYENNNVVPEKSGFNNLVQDKFRIEISPNPVSDQFRFVIPKKFSGKHQIEIIGMNGSSFTGFQSIKGHGIVEIDASSLPVGSYFIGISSNSKIVARAKFIKQ